MIRHLGLGPVGVVRDGESVPLGGGNQRSLLAVLLAHSGRVVGPGTLADALWPTKTDGVTKHAIQTVVSRARRALGDERHELETAAEGYRLSPAASDVADFERLVDRAGSSEPPDAVDALAEALELWRGNAFGELAELEPIRVEAVRLDQLRLSAAEDRFGHMVDLGRFSDAIPDLEAFIALEPLRERSRSLLMQALYWDHRQSDALAVYADYRNLLGEDLGLEPSLEIKKLEEAILTESLTTPASVADGRPRLYGRVGREIAAGPGAADLEQKGWDRLWENDHDGSVEARRRAYVLLLEEGDVAGAARVAIWLGVNAAIRLKMAVAFGWLGRAQQLLASVPVSPVHGLLFGLVGMVEVLNGELDDAVGHARAARQIGLESGHPETEAFGKAIEGWATVRLGERRRGLALMDQAMTSAVSGELGRYVTALIYCRTVCACLDLMDYQRANEWTDEITATRDAGGIADLAGDCRTHRASVLAMQGELDAAEQEATLACAETAEFDMTHLAIARGILGQVCLWRGDLEQAEGHLLAAQEMGESPHPALALLHLARGEVSVAADLIRTAASETSHDPLVHARLLPAVVEVALARGDHREAAEAAGRLSEIADTFQTSALVASADQAQGRALNAAGEHGAAIRRLRAGSRRWTAVGARRHAAHCRLHLAEALLACGRTRDAAVEAQAARDTLAEVGATGDLRSANELIALTT